MSKALDTLIDKNCINGKTTAIKTTKISKEKTPTIDVITKNQKVKPVDTANALKR